MFSLYSKLKKFIPDFHRIEIIYASIALTLGTIMVFLIPPFQSPDEVTHYQRAAALSEGQIVCKAGKLTISKAKSDLSKKMDVDRIAFNKDERFDFDLIRNYKDSSDEKVSEDAVLCSAFPGGHIVPASGIFIGNVLGFNELISFYFGRIFNLVCAVAIISLAIHIIPFGKHIIAILGLLPMSLSIFASMNYDALLIPCIILTVSYLVYLSQRQKLIKPIELIVLAGALIFVSNIKLGYQTLLFLPLILYSKKLFRIRKQYIMFNLALYLINIFMFIMLRKWLGAKLSTFELNDISAPEQLAYILGEPFEYLNVLLLTFIKYFHFYFMSFVGILGWLDYELRGVTYFYTLICGSLFIKIESTIVKLKLAQRAILLGSSIGAIFLIFTGMYLFWTPVRADLVEGVQGRYFIGLALPMVLSMQNLKLGKIVGKNKRIILAVIAVTLVLTIIQILSAVINRYY